MIAMQAAPYRTGNALSFQTSAATNAKAAAPASRLKMNAIGHRVENDERHTGACYGEKDATDAASVEDRFAHGFNIEADGRACNG